MSFTDVMYGNLGQVNNQFQNNLGQNAAMNQGNQAAMQQQQAAAAAQQAQLAALYGQQGFGGQTAYYAGQGAAYGRDTGGFGGYGGMNDPFSPVGGYNSMDAGAYGGAADQQWYLNGSQGPRPSESGGGGGWPTYPGAGGRDMSFPAEPATDWGSVFNQYTAQRSPYSYNSGAVGGGSFGDAADQAWYLGGSQGPRPSSLIMNSGGDTSWLGAGGTQNPYNPFGQINSGQVGQYDAFGGVADQQWYLNGSQGPRPSSLGIGSDTSRDPYAWLYAQSSPYASSYGVPSSPTANLGYNPGMANYFANPGMSVSNVDTSQSAINAATQQMQSLKDWYDQLMFDPNFRQVGSDVPPLPGRGGSTPFVNLPGG